MDNPFTVIFWVLAILVPAVIVLTFAALLDSERRAWPSKAAKKDMQMALVRMPLGWHYYYKQVFKPNQPRLLKKTPVGFYVTAVMLLIFAAVTLYLGIFWYPTL